MKYFISLLFLFIISFLICASVFAEETTDDWGAVINTYQNNDFGKIISTPDYEKAIKTKESFIKKSKKNKKKSGSSTSEQPEEKPLLEVPASPNPLLTLPVDVFYENKVIQRGFYLVSLKYKDGKYFLELKQGDHTPIAEIEAKGNTAPGKSILKPQISVENVNDKMIKINYSGDNLILESTLWKFNK